MACECCREEAIHYSTASVHQYTQLGNQPSSRVSQMSEGPTCCHVHHHDSPHVHTHHGSAHHGQHRHHTMACSAGHCSHQQRHGDATVTDDCCHCRGHDHHTHRHMPPMASPLSITHTPNLPYSPPMFHTPQAVCRSQERCRCQQFLTPQHHQLRLNYGSNPRRQLLSTPVQHHYHKQQPQQHSQAIGHQSYHFSENANYDVNVGHTHSHNHAGVHHQPSSPLSSYAQPLPPSPQAGQPCVNQIGQGETFHLDFSPPCSNAPVPTLPRSHFQLAPNVLEYEDPCEERNGSRSDSQQEHSMQPLYSGPISSNANSTPQLPSHHGQPSQLEHSHPHSIPQLEHSHPHSIPQLEHSHPHSIPQLEHSHPHSIPQREHGHPHSIPVVSRPASISLPRPEVVIERLPLSITKREKVLTSSVDGSKSEAPSQADTSENHVLLNEDPLDGLKKEREDEQPDLTDHPEQPGLIDQPTTVIPKTENRSPHKKWYPAATSTDTDSDQVSDGRKRSLRSSKQRQAGKEGGEVKRLSPRRARRCAAPIVIDTTETESEAEVEPHKASRKTYPLRSKKKVGPSGAELELASSVGQRVRSSSGSQTRQTGMDSGEKPEAKERASPTDSDSEPSPRRRLQRVESAGRPAISEEEEDSALEGEVKVKGEDLKQAEQQVDYDQQLQAVTVEKDPSSLEAGGDGDRPKPVDVEPDVFSQPVDGAKEEPNGDDKEKGKQSVVLEGWYFRVVADGLVILEGTKENDRSGMKWHSGPVARRQSARDLVTRSGACYHLSGELNRDLLSKAGGVDSKDIVWRFRNGFPKDWATLVQRYFEELQKVEPEKECRAPVVDQGNEESEKKATVKSEQDELKTPLLDCSLATSHFLSSLKRSSRGRTLKPSTYSMSPFLNTSTDFYSYDMCGSFEGISSPVVDLTGEGAFVIEPKKPKRRVKTERDLGTTGSDVEDEIRKTENEDSVHKPRLDVKKTKEENTTPDAGRKPEKATRWNRKAEALQTSTVTSVKMHSKHRKKRIIPSALLKKKVKKTFSDVELESTSYSSASQTQEEVVTVERTTTKRSVRIMQKSKEQSSSWSGEESFPERREEDQQTDTEAESNSEGQRGGRGRPRRGVGSRGVAFFRIIADSTESDNSSVERVEKRGRGRPRTQKRGVERANELASMKKVTESDNSSVERVEKRGRGRPRTQKRGVERANELASMKKVTESDNSSVEKRGHGRPRTQKRGDERANELASMKKVTELDNSSIERVEKRGRGRPRTQKRGDERANELASMKKVTESDNSSVERVEKRGRGRPRTQKRGDERASELASMKKVEPSLRISKEAAISADPQEEWTLSGDPREDQELEWTTEDFRSLKSIVHVVPAMTTNFWEVVARRLGTGHSARECSKQYLQATARGPKRMPGRVQERPSDAGAAVPVITGRTGTMKRKRQIRSALEHLDRGYSDDIFDSTPFKKKMKRVELQELSDDECFHDDETSEESRPIRTPSEAKRRLGAPTSHTPKLSDYLTTPDLKSGMRREATDNVMYKIQKAKKGPKKPLKKSAPAAVPKGKLAVYEPLLRNIRTGEVAAIRMFQDSDDESAESSPFSDIEDTYRDIITRLH